MNDIVIAHNSKIHKELKTISALKKLISTLKLNDIFSSISDVRTPGKIQYSLNSLLLWGFNLFVFRLPSKLAMQTHVRHATISSLDHFLCAKKAHHRLTVDYSFTNVSLEKMQNILQQLCH